MQRRRTATATGLYDSFYHIFSFYSFSLHLFVSQKNLNDEARGGNCLLVPQRSYGPGNYMQRSILASSLSRTTLPTTQPISHSAASEWVGLLATNQQATLQFSIFKQQLLPSVLTAAQLTLHSTNYHSILNKAIH